MYISRRKNPMRRVPAEQPRQNTPAAAPAIERTDTPAPHTEAAPLYAELILESPEPAAAEPTAETPASAVQTAETLAEANRAPTEAVAAKQPEAEPMSADPTATEPTAVDPAMSEPPSSENEAAVPGENDYAPNPPVIPPYEGTNDNPPATCDEFLAANPSTGTLKIQAFLGQQALPISGAAVSIYKVCGDGQKLFYSEVTDSDGIIDGLILPTPPRDASLVPGSDASYATYTIIATHPDYYTAQFDRVPVFSGVKSIQNIAFLPRLKTQN